MNDEEMIQAEKLLAAGDSRVIIAGLLSRLQTAERELVFCKHGVYLGDANPSRPCPDCASQRDEPSEAMMLHIMRNRPLPDNVIPDEGLARLLADPLHDPALDRILAENQRMREALERNQAQMGRAQDIMRKHGFKFETRLDLSEGFEKLAFTFYTMLVEVWSDCESARKM